MATPGPLEDRSTRTVLIAAGAAFLVRFLYLLEFHDSVFFSSPILDAAFHDEQARRIAAGHLLEGAPYFRAPLYSWFLGLIYALGGTSPWVPRLVQAALAAAAAGALAWAAGRLLGRRVGLLSGLVYALHGPLVFSSGELLHEALLIPLLVFSLAFFVRAQTDLEDPDAAAWPWFAGAVFLGLAAITRPSALVILPAIVGLPFVVSRAARASGRARHLMVPILAGTLLPILPVTTINYITSGDFILIASQGGINFYSGNNARADGRRPVVPELGDVSAWGDFLALVQARAEDAVGRRLRPSEVSNYWVSRGLDWIRTHPRAAWRLYITKVGVVLSGYEVPNNRDIYVSRRGSVVLSALVGRFGPLFWPWGVLLPLSVLGLALLPRPKPIFLFWSCALLYTLSLLPFFVADRFRLPLVPWLAALAAVGLRSLPAVVRNPRAHAKPLAVTALFLLLANLPLGADTRGNPADTWHKLGEALYNRGSYEAAVEAFDRALEFDPTDDLIRLARAWSFQALGRDSLAARDFEAAARLTDSWQAQYGYGQFLLKHGRTSEAIPYLEHAAGLMPERAELHLELGYAYESTGNYAAAGLALSHALKLGEESAELHLSLGLAALHQGSVEMAETNWKRALELDPRHFRSLYNLGLLRFSQKRLNEAADLWQRAASASPRDPLPHYQLARLAVQRGETARAAEEVATSLRLGLDPAQIRNDPLLQKIENVQGKGTPEGNAPIPG